MEDAEDELVITYQSYNALADYYRNYYQQPFLYYLHIFQHGLEAFQHAHAYPPIHIMEKNDKLMLIELIDISLFSETYLLQDMIFPYMEVHFLLHIYKIIQDINSFTSPLPSLSYTHMSTQHNTHCVKQLFTKKRSLISLFYF